jgi:hypothetical protein
MALHPRPPTSDVEVVFDMLRRRVSRCPGLVPVLARWVLVLARLLLVQARLVPVPVGWVPVFAWCRCRPAGCLVPVRYEVVEVAEAPTDELVELDAVGAVVVVVLGTVVLLGFVAEGGAVVVVVLLGTVVDEVVVVVDFGGVVVVVVGVVAGDWWTTVLEFAVGSGGYWM